MIFLSGKDLADETEREIRSDLVPAYNELLRRGIEKLGAEIGARRTEHECVRSRGVKLALRLYLERTEDGIEEQFEYYQYLHNSFRRHASK